MKKFTAVVDGEVEVTINDPSVITRVTENEDGWCDTYYGHMDVEEVIQHLVFNYVVNRISDISRLDGWADCDPDAVTFSGFRRSVHIDVSKADD